jgi:hypothetical protein
MEQQRAFLKNQFHMRADPQDCTLLHHGSYLSTLLKAGSKHDDLD